MPYDRFYRARCAARHASIRGYYLKCGHTPDEWQHVTQDHILYNRIWRSMLGIPPGDMPPPEPFRK